MRDVSEWLESIGLAEYARTFSDNGVDAELLPDLSNDDLKDIGVARLADRKRILKAITELESAPVETAAQTDEAQIAPADAERRQLTVVFVDLVGSTELSRRLDPEDLRDVMRRYQDAVAGSIARYDGYLAKFLGDGVLAYFGWPQAFEDQTERAVQAGLDAVRAVADITTDTGGAMQARSGIATGQVVVGDLIGKAASDKEAVTGETPNLAARLQGLAAPGEVVVDAMSHRLVDAAFATIPLGQQELKGFSEPIDAWTVVAGKTSESRFEAAHGEQMTKLVGRTHELGLLRDRWTQAGNGEGQVLALSGEAGIGKSRLVQGLCQDVAAQPHVLLRYQCSSRHANTALYPVIRRLEQASGFEASDSVAAKLDKLEDTLRRSGTDISDAAPLLAALLSLPADDRYGVVDMTAPQRRDRLMAILIGQVLELSERQPVLFVVEDAHWIDSTTEILIGDLIARIADRNVLVVVTHRPAYEPPWLDHAHVTAVALSRLSRDQGVEIAKSIGGIELTTETIDRLVARADGVPLFIEELTKTMVESDRQSDGDDIPESLKASMTARLDRLGEARHLAQVASVIGREFGHDLIVKLSGQSHEDADTSLRKLVESGLILQQGRAPDALYHFKHSLVQDSAYGSLLRSRRRQLHGDLAVLLSDLPAGTSGSEPEVIARHWERGGNLASAIDYRVLAARHADSLLAPAEATAHYQHAVTLNERLDDGPEQRRQFLDLMLAMISVRDTTRSSGDERKVAIARADKALAIAEALGDTPSLARLQAYASWFGRAQELLAEALDHAQASGDDAARAEVEMAATGYLGFIGRFEESLASVERAIDLFERMGDEVSLGYALAGEGRCFNARAGRLDQALALAARARHLAERSDKADFRSWLAMEAEPNMYRGNWERVIEIANQDLPAARDEGNVFVLTFVLSWASLACLKLDRLQDAQQRLQEAYDWLKDSPAVEPAEYYVDIVRSAVLLAEGEVEEARAVADDARAKCEAGSWQVEHGAALRVLGEVHAAIGDTDQADAWFRRSLDLFGTIQAQPELAQSLLGYGRFLITADPDRSTPFLQRALALFDDIGADGWAAETKTLLA